MAAQPGADGAIGKPALGLTMFGVTTPCVTAIAERLRADYDCLVFHATGTGGRAMEKLADSGMLAGVIDITTTEVCDLLFGGVLPRRPRTGSAPSRARGLPYVGSVGALDMVNFWAPETVPERYARPAFLPPQPQRHADAHDGRRSAAQSAHGSARKLNRLRRAGALPDPGEGRFGARRRRRRLLRSARPTPRCSTRSRRRSSSTTDRRIVAPAPCTSTIPAFADGRRRRLRESSPTDDRPSCPPSPRQKILEKFHAMIAAGRPIVGGGAGTGLSAKAEEAGGIDLIIIYNSGRYRMAGRGSAAGLLAYGNANEIVKEMAVEVLPVVKHTPVLAGVNGTDPFVLMPHFLAELKTMGFSGVQNFPTIGLFDGAMRQSFEETGMGFGLEVDMIAEAHQARPPDHALCLQPGRSQGDDQGRRRHHRRAYGRDHRRLDRRHVSAKSLDDCVGEIDAIADAARAVRKDVILLCHGGPISMPDDAQLHSASAAPACTASTARLAWNACRPRRRSASRPKTFKAWPSGTMAPST